MSNRNSKQIIIDNEIFSFADLMANPSTYMPKLRPLFRASTLIPRPTDTDEDFYWRLFYLLYYKRPGYAVNGNVTIASNSSTTRRTRRARVIEDDSCHILSALGIDVVKHNPKISKVIFKNSGNVYRMKNSDMDKLAEAIKKNNSFDHRDLDVSIGVELEFCGNRRNLQDFEDAMIKLVGKDRFENLGGYNKNKGVKWILGTDCSIDARRGYPYSGFELTSPILHFNKKDMDELKAVCECIVNTMEGYTNNSCGTHIHMSFTCDSATEDFCLHFAKSYRYSEAKLFDRLVPKRRQGNNSRWCHSTSTYNVWGTRYQKLNFNNVKKNSKDMHLEFRQLDGTLEYDKIYSWIKLQKMFCELTLDSWKESQECNDEKINRLDLDDIVTCKEFNMDEVESLMKMSRMVV